MRSGPMPASSRSSDRTAAPGSPASAYGSRPWRPRSTTLADDGFDAFYEGDVADRQARLFADLGGLLTLGDLRGHASTWGEPIAIDYRGTRVDEPPAEQLGHRRPGAAVDPGPVRGPAGGARSARTA